jgi:uncharacterized repeat protein (TIGR01451 family)
MLLATAALATLTETGTIDVQVTDKGSSKVDRQATTAGAFVSYFGDGDTTFGSSGTGTFDPFVRLQGSPTEQGYNTDGKKNVQFDTKVGTWTHSILVSQIPQRPCPGPEDPSGAPPPPPIGSLTCFELFVDINESNNAKHVSLNDVEVWYTANRNLTGYVATTGFPSGATKVYDFSGSILIHDVNQGSGRGDLRYNIPIDGTNVALPPNCNYGNPDCETYFVLYSKWGTQANIGTINYNSEGGFEEWKVRLYPTPPDITVSKTPDGATINGGQDAVFTITVTNNGPIAAEGVSLSDTLPDSGLSWTLGGANAAACSIGGTPATLTCNFGTIAFPGSRTVTLTSPTTVADCGPINNTVTVSSTNEDPLQLGNNSDTGDITVACGALQITKTAKHADTSGDTSADLVATFTITDAGGNERTLTTDATGVGCIDGVAVGNTTSIVETSVPSGYSAPTIANANVASGNCNGNVLGTGGTSIGVENTPLTDITWTVDSLRAGATSTTVTCYDGTGTVIDGYPVTVSNDTGTVPDLPPSAPGTTLSCDFVVDP